MKSKLLVAALFIIAAFAIADLTRAATATLATFLASSAVPRVVVSDSIRQSPPVRRATLADVGSN